jgi:uncharacterized protein (TIGR03084 family)
MTMQQVDDFRAESDALGAVLEGLSDTDWSRETLFKGWTINDILVHLHFWNVAADLSLTNPDAFAEFAKEVSPLVAKIGMRDMENPRVQERGRDLFDLWQATYRDMAQRWAEVDPKARLAWMGPTMSARSSMTARQMETWAHGQAVFDVLGIERIEADRIKNIVILGVNTFGWTHIVRGWDVPTQMPYLDLTAPSGDRWQFGEIGEDRITGQASEFAQVVTQTRSIEDTNLVITGSVAQRWMDNAQCFAGRAETPPAKGQRRREGHS